MPNELIAKRVFDLMLSFSLNYLKSLPAGIFLLFLTMSITISIIETPFAGLIGLGVSIIFNNWEGNTSYSYSGPATPVIIAYGNWFFLLTAILAFINLFLKIKVNFNKTLGAVVIIILLANLRIFLVYDVQMAIILSVLEFGSFFIYLKLSIPAKQIR